MGRKQPLKIPRDNIPEGIKLCNQNARHLLRDAEMLLESHSSYGNNGSVYLLWSLAVEEYGKQLLLQELFDAVPPIAEIEVGDLFGGWKSHQRKFDKGYRALVLQGIQAFATVVKVVNNSQSSAVTLQDPWSANSSISVSGGSTGIFEDVSDYNQLTPSVDLRFNLMYVDWKSYGTYIDPQTNEPVKTDWKWVDPRTNASSAGITAEFSIKDSDLKGAIECLRLCLKVASH